MAADNGLVTPLAYSLPRTADSRAQNKYQIGTKALPVVVTKIVGELVTVAVQAKGNFTIPQILIPQAFPAWMRWPTQVGDKGWAVPADLYLGGMSGLGGGTADYWDRGNLTPLVFVQISQKQFPTNPTRDLNAVFVNGPNGVVLQDTKGNNIFTLTPTGITVKLGSVTFTFDKDGFHVDGGGAKIFNQGHDVGFDHVHTLVTPGTDDTGPPP